MKAFSSFFVHLSRVTLCLLVLAGGVVSAQNVMTIDATAPAPKPEPVAARLGTAANSQGETIGVNSQYLTFDDKPWLPVMGEFHFSRYPAAEWEQEILKMKAAGVQIISTYIIWIHHEETEGVFDWKGQRDLRAFVELCAKHGMYVYPRVGPWAHAETRNGGLPDWVLKNGPTRQNDPAYLKEVGRFYKEIGAQLHGLYWKDGGPVIGIQIENEYRSTGAGKGVEHIRTLKQMAIAAGMDVPLYTVTGWDGAAIPLDAALPVFGGYPDAPWDSSTKQLPPNEVYAFRFNNRSAGSMGAIGGRGQSSAATYKGSPFLTAEVGDGIEDTYLRRPVVDADDIASIPTVMLGSGVNLLGYYMFHGGRNPDGGDITLQESQRTGYPTDVPVESYDFQAPLGEFGQQRESLRKLKLVHYFLNDFGSELAPMTPRAPARTPATPADASIPRVAARTLGEQGFLFLSNYVRTLDMPNRSGFQIQLHLPSGIISIPETPISLPSGAYGIWPVNLPVGGTTLRYSTAQLFKRVKANNETYLFFFAIPGIAPEFVFDPTAQIIKTSETITKNSTATGLHLRVAGSLPAEIHLAGGIHVVLLPEANAEDLWRVDDPGLLLSTSNVAFSDGPTWTIQSDGDPNISFGIFGSTTPPKAFDTALRAAPDIGLFHQYKAGLSPVDLQVKQVQIQPAGPPPAPVFGPDLQWRSKPVPMLPEDDAFKSAAVWKIVLPPVPASPHVSDVFLHIDYQGDVARLYQGSKLVDDNFWNGLPWSIGMKELSNSWHKPDAELELRVLPLSNTLPLYIQKASELRFNAAGVVDNLLSVRLIPQYQLVLSIPSVPQAKP
jgi:beta-galactosidase